MSDFDDEEYESFELDGAGKPRESGAAPAEADDDLDDDDDLEDAAEDEIDFVLAAYREDGQPYVQALAKDLANDFDELIIQLRRLPGDAGALGFVSYGLSLALFVVALRHLGTARTGAYFATAPFVGALIAVPLLDESVTASLLAGGALMVAGVWLHLTERHEHGHFHEALAHEHRHVHDDHHQHHHGGPVTEPHSHWHEHKPMRHKHPHYPDLHHRHGH